MKTSFVSFHRSLTLGLLLLTGLTTESLHADSVKVTKLYAKHPRGQQSNGFGSSVAVNDRWLVVGEPGHHEPGNIGGAVLVYHAATGAFARRIAPFPAEPNLQFGHSVAVSGNRAVVGGRYHAWIIDLVTGRVLHDLKTYLNDPTQRYGDAVAMSGRYALVSDTLAEGAAPQSGAVYVFDASTGAYVRKLQGGAQTAAQFGFSLATDGRVAAVGAFLDKGQVDQSGAAYVFDLSSGLLLRKVFDSNGAEEDLFGISIGLSKNRLIVGAPYKDNAYGAVFAYDLISGAQSKLVPPNPGEDLYGDGISVSGSRVLISAPGKDVGTFNTGAAYVFDLDSGEAPELLTASDASKYNYLGEALAMHENTIVLASPLDDDMGEDAGAVYLLRNCARPAPYGLVAKQGTFAPGTPGQFFNSFGQPSIDSEGTVILPANLKGGKTTAANNDGIWRSKGNILNKVLRESEIFGDPMFDHEKVFLPGRVLNNQGGFGLIEIGLSGYGYNASNNRGFYGFGPLGFTDILNYGEALPGFNNEKLGSVTEVVQSSISACQGFRIKLAASAGVSAATDGGVLLRDNGDIDNDLFSAREGDNNPYSGKYGEFHRVAVTGAQAVYAAAMVTQGSAKQGVFHSTTGAVAVNGMTAAGTAGAKFETFAGEAVSGFNLPVLRATIKGAGINSKNNTGLWLQATAGADPTLVARKGDPIQGMGAGVVWSRFPQYWAITSTGGVQMVLFVADLRGPGVTAANDRSLWLRQEDGSLRLLLREGDVLNDGSGARVLNLQRVVAHPIGGHYAVQVSLAGALASNNQAILRGNVRTGLITASLYRAPILHLRKGRAFDDLLGPSGALTSLTVSPGGTDATGAGGKGLAQSINSFGELVITAGFKDGTKALVKCVP